MRHLTIARSPDEKVIEISVGEIEIMTLTHGQYGFSVMDEIQCGIEATARALGAQILYKELED